MKTSVKMIAAFTGLLLVSCAKDYTCECRKVRTDSNGTIRSSIDEAYTFHDARPRAESKCNLQEIAGEDNDGSFTRECKIQ